MTTLTVSEARAQLPAVLDRVARGEEVTITRHGRAAAVVVGPNALRHRRAAASAAIERAGALRRAREAARDEALEALDVLTDEWAEQRVRELRAERDAG